MALCLESILDQHDVRSTESILPEISLGSLALAPSQLDQRSKLSNLCVSFCATRDVVLTSLYHAMRSRLRHCS